MNIKVIKTELEYEAALERIEELMEALPGTPEEDELDVLALLVETYESQNYPIGIPDPIEAIKFFMDQKQLSNTDMIEYLGSASKVSEILNRKRGLSKQMIRNLVEGLGIPADILLEVKPSSNISSYTSSFYESPLALSAWDDGGFISCEKTMSPPRYNPKAKYNLAA